MSELELWKKISNDGNGNYEVSTLGNVRHSSTKVQKKFDIEKLKQTKTRIRFNGHYLHRLIALTFIANPNPENMKEVNHKDGDPYNNQVANLEWITRENNMKHFHANNKYACKYMRRILLIRADSNAVERAFNCLEECITALNLNVSYAKIYAKLNNNHIKYAKKGILDDGAGAGAVDAIYNIDESRFIKFEDNNNNLSYDDDNDNDNDDDNDNDNDNDTAVEWVEVREAPKYMVSNTGQVKQKRLNRFLKGYLINGYKSVSLKSECESGQICRLVHRLVAEAFIANDDPARKIYVDHIDTNISNNDRRNLRWVTPKENVNNELTKQNISIGKLKNSKRIFKIDVTTKEVLASYQNYKEVEKCEPGISYKTVYSICSYYRHAMRHAMNGDLEAPAYKTKKYDNYLFLFEDELAQMNACIELALAVVVRKSVVVYQYDKDANEPIGEFETAYQASKQLNINYSGINQVVNYHRYSDASRPKCYKLKTTHGFIFREKV